jgi:serine/threonine-protein kinase
MVLKGNMAKITDFGIARLPNSAVKTMTGLILGSPRYMSPEQVIGKAIDSRSDIFSLGVVLYEALTGVPPFDGDNVNAIMYATVNTTPPPPSVHNRNVPPMLDLIAAKAMAKLLEDRYQTIKEFADDLREVRRQMDASKPANALKAAMAPPMRTSAPSPASIVDRVVDTATIPINTDKTEAEEAKPLAIAKTFDSFDATMRLAAMTDQTDDFKEYISETQKMRAYRGKIEPNSPLAPKAAPAPAPAPEPAPPPPAPKPPPPEKKKAAPKPPPPEKKPAPPPVQLPNPLFDEGPQGSSALTNLIAAGAIVLLSLAAVGLIVALVMK